MKLLTGYLLLQTAGLATALPPKLEDFKQKAIDSGVALKALNGIALAKALTKFSGTCTPSKVKYRREWRTISKPDRRKFIAAVKCIMAKPSTLPPGEVPGAKSLYDDIVWAHARRSGLVHNSGTFLLFHRYYLHTYETELSACGWTAGLPYWEWGLDITGPHLSPVFDGSDTSLGGDGEFIPNRPPFSIPWIDPLTPEIIIQPGTGGGCVKTGPFVHHKVRLGPFNMTETFPVEPEDGRGDNERCLIRDLNKGGIERWASFRNSTELILGSGDIFEFHVNAEGDPRWLDRVYWIWQMLDLESRSVSSAERSRLLCDMKADLASDRTSLGLARGSTSRLVLMLLWKTASMCYLISRRES
ncbi:Putative tyrosinase [Podospora comata]|uniref:Tyrosinase n=1 Tax=Podospora comata TaxID=48703 RepID=A0ABY6SGU0_PODCO|nr:Putative tyrosinase [Podospora comata]